MVGNPFNEERQQELKDRCQEFLTKFGQSYGVNVGIALFNTIAAEEEARVNPDKSHRLPYRDWFNVQRAALFQGFAYMKSGFGEGNLNSWKKYYFVERLDYNIDYYKSDKTYKQGKKPDGTIKMAGYHVVAEPRRYFQQQWDQLKADMGIADTSIIGYSVHSWALIQEHKVKYLFQLHKGTDPSCGCLGGGAVEPDDKGAEEASEKDKWFEFMSMCAERAQDRDHDAVSSQAFDMTVDDMRTEYEVLSEYDAVGTPSEVLVCMLMLYAVEPLKSAILAELAGPFKMRVSLAFKISSTIQSSLASMVNPALSSMLSACETTTKTLDPKMRPIVAKLVEVRNTVKDKIRDKLDTKLASLLDKYVNPHIKEAVQMFERPMKEGFDEARAIFENKLPEIKGDPLSINATLDDVPRDALLVQGITAAAESLVQPLETMKAITPTFFSHVNSRGMKALAEKRMLETLDAAINALEIKIAADGLQNVNLYKAEILQDFDHDVAVERNMVAKQIVKNMFVDGLKRVFLQESPAADLLDTIPSEFQDMIDIKGMIDAVIDFSVGKPCDLAIDGLFPLPDAVIKATPENLQE